VSLVTAATATDGAGIRPVRASPQCPEFLDDAHRGVDRDDEGDDGGVGDVGRDQRPAERDEQNHDQWSRAGSGGGGPLDTGSGGGGALDTRSGRRCRRPEAGGRPERVSSCRLPALETRLIMTASRFPQVP